MLLNEAINIHNKENTKKVDYFGLELKVPEETVAIATDEDGMVYFYTKIPETDEHIWVSDSNHSIDGFLLGEDIVIEDWKESLLVL